MTFWPKDVASCISDVLGLLTFCLAVFAGSVASKYRRLMLFPKYEERLQTLCNGMTSLLKDYAVHKPELVAHLSQLLGELGSLKGITAGELRGHIDALCRDIETFLKQPSELLARDCWSSTYQLIRRLHNAHELMRLG